MKHCGEFIKEMLVRKHLQQNDLGRAFNKSESWVTKLLKKSSIDSKLLEEICMYLQIDPMVFYDYRPLDQNVVNPDIKQNVGIGHAEITVSDPRLIDKLLATYDARIEGYEAQIKSLESTVSVLRSLLAEKVKCDNVG